ncbi:MAG TPA: nucleotide exchange factor GrpE [Patescibacteria group bacterium]|nr:nucleotide exchange factor GrpE [Patescibacteria group bacterium]
MSNGTEREKKEHVLGEEASWEDAVKNVEEECENAGRARQQAVMEPGDTSGGEDTAGGGDDREGGGESGLEEKSMDAGPEDAGRENGPHDREHDGQAERGDDTERTAGQKGEVQKRTKRSRKELLAILDKQQDELERAREESDNIKQQIVIKEDKLIRVVAEFENYKKRTRREWELHQKRANADLIKEILGILDDFERAFEAPDDSGEHFRSGVQLIHSGLLDVMERAGLTEIEAENKPFDPQYHEALGVVASDEVEEGCVANVVQKGYLLRGQLLRPAKVIVVKAKESQE